MVWVFGNSHERVIIKDLNDTIYFRQKKQYSDQEFESSKDLQREIQKSRIIKLEHIPEIKGSMPGNLNGNGQRQQNSVDLSEIRKIITEVVSEQSNGVNVKDLVTSLVPIIAETIRQEVSKVSVGQGPGPQNKFSENNFQEMTYIPEVSIEGMVSNIQIKDRTSNASDVNNSLEALRRLQGIK